MPYAALYNFRCLEDASAERPPNTGGNYQLVSRPGSSKAKGATLEFSYVINLYFIRS